MAGTVCREVLQGIAFGIGACVLFVRLAGGSAASFELALIWGSCVGALIGLLLWAGSSELPEERVLPPSPEQKRKSGDER